MSQLFQNYQASDCEHFYKSRALSLKGRRAQALDLSSASVINGSYLKARA